MNTRHLVALCAVVTSALMACERGDAEHASPRAVAATPEAPAESSEAEAPGPAASRRPTFTPPPKHPAPVAERPSWRWHVDERGEALKMDSVTAHVDATRRVRCEYDRELEPARDAVTCWGLAAAPGGVGETRKELWSRELEPEFVGAAALVSAGRTLFVAHYSAISSGGVVRAFDIIDGTPRWERAIEGLGPIQHSEYRNEIQLVVRDGALHVFGKESAGAYIERFALGDGAQLSLHRVEDAIAEVELGADITEPPSTGRVTTMGSHGGEDLLYELSPSRGGEATLRQRATDGEENWAVEIARAEVLERAQLLEHGDVLFVWLYAGRSEQARLELRSANDGRLLAERDRASSASRKVRERAVSLRRVGDVVGIFESSRVADMPASRVANLYDARGELVAVHTAWPMLARVVFDAAGLGPQLAR